MSRARAAALVEDYRPADPGQRLLREQFLSFIGAEPSCLERSCRSAHLTASALVLSPDETKVLLLYHRKLQRWLQPGGHADGRSDLEEVARQEVQEETGLELLQLLARGVFDLDIHKIPAAGSMPEHLHYDVRFLFRADSMTVAGNHESNGLRWATPTEAEMLAGEDSLSRMLQKAFRQRAVRSYPAEDTSALRGRRCRHA